MRDFLWLYGTLLYALLHFFIYATTLRHLRAFRREGAMMFYHAVSFVLLALITLVFYMGAGRGVAAPLVCVMALHGIYSLSFLELWSLSDGGYSLRILDRVEIAHEKGQQVNMSDLEKLASLKKEDRLESLLRMGLIEQRGEAFHATRLGRTVSSVIQGFIWLCNLKIRG